MISSSFIAATVILGLPLWLCMPTQEASQQQHSYNNNQNSLPPLRELLGEFLLNTNERSHDSQAFSSEPEKKKVVKTWEYEPGQELAPILTQGIANEQSQQRAPRKNHSPGSSLQDGLTTLNSPDLVGERSEYDTERLSDIEEYMRENCWLTSNTKLKAYEAKVKALPTNENSKKVKKEQGKWDQLSHIINLITRDNPNEVMKLPTAVDAKHISKMVDRVIAYLAADITRMTEMRSLRRYDLGGLTMEDLRKYADPAFLESRKSSKDTPNDAVQRCNRERYQREKLVAFIVRYKPEFKVPENLHARPLLQLCAIEAIQLIETHKL